jgi:tetratricopeptide (TPR) repeat protein
MTRRLLALFVLVVSPCDPEFAYAQGTSTPVSTDWKHLDAEVRRLHAAGFFVEARRDALLAVERVVAEAGPDHVDVASTLDLLAAQHEILGASEEAERALERSQSIWERVAGRDSADVLPSVMRLAEFNLRRGELPKAELYFERALLLCERVQGPDHPNVPRLLQLAAAVDIRLGKGAEAIEKLKRCIGCREISLGPEHPDVATALDDLAELYTEESQTREQLVLRALSIREKALGSDHLDLARSLENLAIIHRSRREFARAERLLMRALSIRERVLGPDHFLLEASLRGLANVYDSAGEYAQMESMRRRWLSCLESLRCNQPARAVGFDFFEASIARAWLGLRGFNYERAELCLKSASVHLAKSVGPDHPSMAKCLINLAQLHRAQGEYVKAVPLTQRAIEIQKRALEAGHPDLTNSLKLLDLLGRSPMKGEDARSPNRAGDLESEGQQVVP